MNPEAQEKAEALNAELVQRREILTADQLASLVAPRARLEQSFERISAYFFTISGMLNGRKVEGALFAGECMLVFAISERAAQEQANAGLRRTVELLHEEYESRDMRLSPAMQGLSAEAAGRKALAERRVLVGREAEQREVLRRMMADAMADPKNWKP